MIHHFQIIVKPCIVEIGTFLTFILYSMKVEATSAISSRNLKKHDILCSVMHRMFVAIPISEDAKKATLEAQEQLKEMFRYSKITWVDSDQFHITLHFLGDI